MTILDARGRLFGKLSLLDLGAALVIALAIIGIFFFPGTTGSIAQVNQENQVIEFDAIVRGLSVRDPDALLREFEAAGTTNIVIRNQPAGSVEIRAVTPLARQIIVPQPDGSVAVLPDPRTYADVLSTDMILTLAGQAQMTPDGAVLSGNKIKIGTPLELEGSDYRFNASTIDVRLVEE
ncbi:MAG: DUF4330 domain-containing protein [Spirulinaceae cyanobacterium SM2_1_0]|nr:DUF4330 domain-containing protein [Spirulinaceae cyanobacterium SM2_1_0]